MFIAKSFSIFFVCLLAACGNSISQTADSISTEKPDLSLTMEKSQCLGNCPVYKLEVLQNGYVSFERFSLSEKDSSFSKSNGKKEANLSEEKINQIIAEIDKTDFFALKTIIQILETKEIARRITRP